MFWYESNPAVRWNVNVERAAVPFLLWLGGERLITIIHRILRVRKFFVHLQKNDEYMKTINKFLFTLESYPQLAGELTVQIIPAGNGSTEEVVCVSVQEGLLLFVIG